MPGTTTAPPRPRIPRQPATSSPSVPAPAAAPRILISPAYRRLWAGQAVSVTGDRMSQLTLVLWTAQDLAAGRSWAPAAVGGLLIAAGVAAILAAPAAGILADRWIRSRATVMITADLARAAIAAALAAVSFLPLSDLDGTLVIGLVYAAVFTMAAIGQLFTVAQTALTADLVPTEPGRARAAAITEVTASASSVIGPAAAAPLMLATGPHWALAVNAASYLISALAVRSLRAAAISPPASVPPPARRRLRSEITEARLAFAGNRTLAVLLSVTVTCQAGAAAPTVLGLFFITRVLHASPGMYGTSELVMGAGFILGALAAGRLVRMAGFRRLTWAALAAAGGLLAIYGLQRDIVPALAVIGLYAAAISVLNTSAGPVLMAAAEPEVLGRVLAIFGPVNQLASATAIGAWGWLDTTLGGCHAAACGAGLSPLTLMFLAAGLLIVAASARAAAALPRQPSAMQVRR